MINTNLPSFEDIFEGTHTDRLLRMLGNGITLVGTSCLIKRKSDGFIWVAGKITALDDFYMELQVQTTPTPKFTNIHTAILLDSDKLVFLI
jgi:hypothetical protein